MSRLADRIPLMLIHGAWLSARSWERFEDYFTQRGFDVTAPEWPRKHGDVEALRDDADELAGLGSTRSSTTTRRSSARCPSRRCWSATRSAG